MEPLNWVYVIRNYELDLYKMKDMLQNSIFSFSEGGFQNVLD